MSMNVRINSKGFTHRSPDLDDTDKRIVVPPGESWDIESVYLVLTTTSTAGNRQIVVEIIDTDTTTVLLAVAAGVIQAASTTVSYSFARGLENQDAINFGILTTAFPQLRLEPGEAVRVYDEAAIDPTADDMVFHLMAQTTRS